MWFLPWLISDTTGGARTETITAAQFTFTPQSIAVSAIKVITATQFTFTPQAVIVSIVKLIGASAFSFIGQALTIIGAGADAIVAISGKIRRCLRR